MEGLILQQWCTTRGQGGAGIRTVTQSQSAWLDLAGYRDVVAWLDVREASADAGVSVQLTFQTAPTLDESLFVPMNAPVVMAPGLTLVPMLAALAAAPLARYLRWTLGPSASTTAAWDVTFRCIIAANRPGSCGRNARPVLPQPQASPPRPPPRMVTAPRTAVQPARPPNPNQLP